jgi:hypothetical protein
MLLAGEAEGVCSGGGGGVTDSAGEIDIAGGSSAVEEGVGDGDSWAKTAIAKSAVKIVALVLIVMSSGVETSRIKLITR